MKKMMIIAMFLTLGFTLKSEAAPIMNGGDYGYFYSNLSPYGSWIQIDYNTTVWSPRIYDRNWAPYTSGRWIWTSDGWYWDSYEPFGYITYHYGRWYYDDYYGWLWVPDYQWAPAWVEWRYDNAYIGWAPLSPYADFSINIGIHFTTNYSTPYTHWRFVKYNYFCDPYVAKYYVGPKYKYRIFSKTKYRTNYGFSNGRVVNRGVDISYIRNRSGQKIVERNIRAVSNARDLETVKDRTRNSGEVRSFIATRDELSRGNTQDVKIERAERKTSLETTRIQLNRKNDVTPRVRSSETEVRTNRNSDEKTVERRVENLPRKNNSRDVKTESRNDRQKVERNREVYVPKSNAQEQINRRKIESKREVRTETRQQNTNNRIVPKREVNRQEVNRQRQPSPKIERKSSGSERSKSSTRNSRERKR